MAALDLTDGALEAISAQSIALQVDPLLKRWLFHVFESGVFFQLADVEVDTFRADRLGIEYVRLKRRGAPIARSRPDGCVVSTAVAIDACAWTLRRR